MKLHYATPRRYVVTHIWPKRPWYARPIVLRLRPGSGRGAAYGLLVSIFVCAIYAGWLWTLEVTGTYTGYRWYFDYAWCVFMLIPALCAGVGVLLFSVFGRSE